MANIRNVFWSGWIITLTVTSLAALTWLLFSIYWSARTRAEEKKFEEADPVWDEDMHEGHAAPPMWWFWFLFCILVFTAGYLMLYPRLGCYKRALEWTMSGRIDAAYGTFDERLEVEWCRIALLSFSA